MPTSVLAPLLAAAAALVPEPGLIVRDPWLEDMDGCIKELGNEGRFAEAERETRDTLRWIEGWYGPDDYYTSRFVSNLVQVLHRQGRAKDPETLALARRAVVLEEEVGLGGQAGTLIQLSTILRLRGDLTEAKEVCEQAIRIVSVTHPRDGNTLASVYHRLGLAEFALGDHDGARLAYDRALRFCDQDADRCDPSFVLQSFGNLMVETGDYAEAARLHARVVKLFEDNRQGPFFIAGAEANLGRDLMNLGDWSGARPHLERALTMSESALGPAHENVAVAAHNLAVTLAALGESARSRELYARALAIRERSLGRDHLEVALTLLDAGSSAMDEGRLEPAERLLRRALAILSKGSHDEVDTAHCLDALAEVRLLSGDPAEARELSSRSLDIRKATFGKEHFFVGQSLIGLARASLAAGNTSAALDAALEGERLSRRHLRLSSRALSERQALSFTKNHVSGFDVAIAAGVAAGTDLAARLTLDTLIQSRAIVLDEMAMRLKAARNVGDPDVARRVERLGAATRRYTQIADRGPGEEAADAYRKRVDRLREQAEQAERDLAEVSRSFVNLDPSRAVGLEQVQASLPPHAGLVGYARYLGSTRGAARYAAFMVPPDGASPALVDLGSADAIDAAVAAWRAALSMPPSPIRSLALGQEREARSAGERLRSLVWDPVVARLAASKLVFVVPDGSLNLLSLATLPSPDGRYLVEAEPSFHLLSAERDLATLPPDRPAGSGLLAVGGPDFETGALGAVARADGAYRGRSPGCERFRDLRFAPLPGSRREVEDVAALWRTGGGGAVRLLTGELASEGELKQIARGFDVVHLATHGFFIDPDCAAHSGDPPLLGSGLALSGANRRERAGVGEDDGLLTAEEVSTLDFSGARWVVLSACGTGLGTVVDGEGVLGLRRAFRVAGARTLILSLWKVQDEEARAWMHELYAARMSGLSTVDSVRTASLKVIASRRAAGLDTHPYHWGAFLAEGDWR